MDFKTKSFFTGVAGDLILQAWVRKQGDLAGLEKYFEQHGVFESTMIAGGQCSASLMLMNSVGSLKII